LLLLSDWNRSFSWAFVWLYLNVQARPTSSALTLISCQHRLPS
jgi:hypothetical protein